MKLDIWESESAVARYMIKRGRRPTQNWKTFIHNHDRIFGAEVEQAFRDLGIEQLVTAPRSPWQNGYSRPSTRRTALPWARQEAPDG